MYHTDVMISYKLNMLDKDQQRRIPSSTRHNWKKRNISQITGLDSAQCSEQNLEMMRQFLANKKLLKMARAVFVVYNAYATIFKNLPNKKKVFQQHHELIVDSFDQVKETMGTKNALVAFGISSHTLRQWRNTINCMKSPLGLCRKVYYNQLTTNESDTIIKYLGNASHKYWKTIHVYYQMLRDKAAYMNRSTFYKYARIFGFKHFKIKKSKYAVGIRADRPGQILHMDVTIYRPADHVRVYIYIVIDNFSRCILGCRASLKYSAQIAMENLKDAYNNHNLKTLNSEIVLLTDGGSENQGKVDDFINQPHVNIIRKIAHSLRISNSMIEAVNKRMKYEHLFCSDLQNFSDVENKLPDLVNDYCNKPHGALYGLSPNEVMDGEIPDKFMFSQQIKQAGIGRRQQNQNVQCEECTDEQQK